MMSRWLRLLPVLLAAFWLPLAAVAAATMPFCRHGEAPAPVQMEPTSQMEMAGHVHCHEAEGNDTGSAPASPDGLGCDSCGFCHLACATLVPAAVATAVVLPPDRSFGLMSVALHPDHIPELLQPPPRTI